MGSSEYGEADNDTPTSTPVIGSPADEAINIAVTASINWTDGNTGAATGDADFYDAWFDAVDGSTKVVDNSTVLTYDPGTLDNNEVYYWKVLARNDNNTSTSDVWEFTTTAPSSLLPVSGINDGGLTITNINDGNLTISNVQ